MQHCISVNCIPIDLTLALFDVCCEYVFLASVDNFAQLLTIIGEMWQCGVTFIIQCSALTVWHFFHFFFSVIFLISVRSGPDIFLSLSLLQAGLDPSGEGSATRVLRLHSALFSTSIRSTRKSSMLYFTASIHLFLCLSLYTLLSTYVCLQDSPVTILLFSALYMPKPSQPGLPYLVRDDDTPSMRRISSFSLFCLST